MDNVYKHVDGVFYEELEALIALHRSCEIIFRGENGARTVIRDRITELYVREGRDWLRTATGLSIGLDRLEKVDSHSPSGLA